MGSGRYSALAGAIGREQAMASISHNLANVNSTGFKKDRVSFESLLRNARQSDTARGVNYSRVSAIKPDLGPGPLQATGNDLDLAIHGDGYFKVRDADGNTFYTRKGNFSLNTNGELQTESGHLLLDDSGSPISLPPVGGKSLSIAENGLMVLDGAEVGTIGTYVPEDPGQMTKTSNALFSSPPGSAERAAENSRIIQGHLEMSNVNMVEEMALMIDTMRNHETLHKVLKSYGALGDKLNELGTVA